MTHPHAAGAPVPVLFVHYGDDWIRGSERCLLDLLANLDRDRFQPLVWCNARAMFEAVQELAVPVWRDSFPISLDADSPRFSMASYWTLVQRARGLIRDHGIRLVHANSVAPNQWVIPAARAGRVPVLTHVHAVYSRRSRFLLGLHQASLAVGVSRAAISPLEGDGMDPARLRVIYNGVDPVRLGSGNARGLRESLGIGRDAVALVCVASLIRGKGIDTLVRALPLLPPDVHVISVGEGQDRRYFETLAGQLGVAQRMHFLGERRDAGAIYRDAADIAVLATRAEAFGLVLLEAAAMGVPAIATSVGGVPEVIVNGETGLLVAPERPAELAHAIRWMARNDAARREMGLRARRRVESQFTARGTARAFESEYDELLRRPARGHGWRETWASRGPYRRLLSGALARWTSNPEGAAGGAAI